MSLSLTPAQVATLQSAITNVITPLQAALAAVTGYTREQQAAARLAILYYTGLSQNIGRLVTNPTSMQYTVVAGDTLFTIAQTQLGDATEYSAIMQANNLTEYPVTSGQNLIIPVVKR